MSNEKAQSKITLKLRSLWQRYVVEEATPRQIKFDLVYGIILPVICYVCDPIVFRGSFGMLMRLDTYRLPVYLFSLVTILTLGRWLWGSQRIRTSGGFAAGIMLTGALYAFTLGVIMLPLSLMALTFLVGIIGFIPFVTAFVYLKNGLRALRAAQFATSRPALVSSILLSALLLIAGPVLIHRAIALEVSRAVADITREEPLQVETDLKRLEEFSWYASPRDLLLAYMEAKTPSQARNLARAYESITGESIIRGLDRMKN